MARPKRVFTEQEKAEIERYARNNSLTQTIAVALDIPVNTLKRRFGRKLRIWRAVGKVELRDNLYKQAKNSPQTAIFIAKNELGMTDKQVLTVEQPIKAQTEVEKAASTDAARAYKLKLSRGEDNAVKRTG